MKFSNLATSFIRNTVEARHSPTSHVTWAAWLFKSLHLKEKHTTLTQGAYICVLFEEDGKEKASMKQITQTSEVNKPCVQFNWSGQREMKPQQNQ